MKNLLTKTLFISLLSSAAISSGVQASLFASARGSLTEALSSTANIE